MPELPDLEIYKGNLTNHLLGKKILKATLLQTNRINFLPTDFESTFTHKIFNNVERHGKELWFTFNDAPTLSIHLMLSGKFSISKTKKFPQFLKLAIELDDNTFFYLSDKKGLATLKIDPQEQDALDVFDPNFTLDFFMDILKNNQRTRIKKLLLDQSKMRGIGNAYADEILYETKLHPESIAGKIPLDVAQNLYENIHSVLQNAIKELQTLTPNAISGENRTFLKVHNFNIKETILGEKIIRKRINSRETLFTESQIQYQ